jgi:glycosyltransferase involved in cell wall biosynthesis
MPPKLRPTTATILGNLWRRAASARAPSGDKVFRRAAAAPAPHSPSTSRIDPAHTPAALITQRDQRTAAPLAPQIRTKTTCLINNYNYARFVHEAVDSALAQTFPFDEIIVVDDGSTDESIQTLTRRFGDEPRVRIISKQNGGQLSSFNEGFLRATGDILFFLDADDIYEPAYVETMLDLYAQRPEIDFAFCALRLFGADDGEFYRFPADTDFGYTMALTYFAMPWIGNATSCISARRNLLARFLPLPNTHDFRIRADDCLVFGASIAGARKYFLHECLIRRRVHANNGFHGHRLEEVRDYPYLMTLQRLRGVLRDRLGLIDQSVAEHLAVEFRTIPNPTWNQLRQYSRLASRSLLNPIMRIRGLKEINEHFRRSSPEIKSFRDSLRAWASSFRWRYCG